MQERKKGLFLEDGCQNGPWIKEAHKVELERSWQSWHQLHKNHFLANYETSRKKKMRRTHNED